MVDRRKRSLPSDCFVSKKKRLPGSRLSIEQLHKMLKGTNDEVIIAIRRIVEEMRQYDKKKVIELLGLQSLLCRKGWVFVRDRLRKKDSHILDLAYCAFVGYLSGGRISESMAYRNTLDTVNRLRPKQASLEYLSYLIPPFAQARLNLKPLIGELPCAVSSNHDDPSSAFVRVVGAFVNMVLDRDQGISYLGIKGLRILADHLTERLQMGSQHGFIWTSQIIRYILKALGPLFGPSGVEGQGFLSTCVEECVARFSEDCTSMSELMEVCKELAIVRKMKYWVPTANPRHIGESLGKTATKLIIDWSDSNDLGSGLPKLARLICLLHDPLQGGAACIISKVAEKVDTLRGNELVRDLVDFADVVVQVYRGESSGKLLQPDTSMSLLCINCSRILAKIYKSLDSLTAVQMRRWAWAVGFIGHDIVKLRSAYPDRSVRASQLDQVIVVLRSAAYTAAEVISNIHQDPKEGNIDHCWEAFATISVCLWACGRLNCSLPPGIVKMIAIRIEEGMRIRFDLLTTVLWTTFILHQSCRPILHVIVTNPEGSIIGLQDASLQNRIIVMAAMHKEYLDMRADPSLRSKIGPDFHTFAWILASKIKLDDTVDNKSLCLILQTLGETAKESQLLHPFEGSEIYADFIGPLTEVLSERTLDWGHSLLLLQSVSALCFSTAYPATGFENVQKLCTVLAKSATKVQISKVTARVLASVMHACWNATKGGCPFSDDFMSIFNTTIISGEVLPSQESLISLFTAPS